MSGDWSAKEYDRLSVAITGEAELHLPKIYVGTHFADISENAQFFCTICRNPWPCRFLNWARRAFKSPEFAPLKLTLVHSAASLTAEDGKQ